MLDLSAELPFPQRPPEEGELVLHVKCLSEVLTLNIEHSLTSSKVPRRAETDTRCSTVYWLHCSAGALEHEMLNYTPGIGMSIN